MGNEKWGMINRKTLLNFAFRAFISALMTINISINAQDLKISAIIKIIDRSNNSPKPNTNLVIKEAGGYYTTDVNGITKISVPSPGYYTIRIIVNDKVEVFQKEIYYTGQQINLFIGSREIGSINVKGETDKVKLSRYSFQQEEIKRLPGAQGDSLKALQTLPGIMPAIPLGLNSSSAAFGNTNANPNSSPYKNSERGTLVLRGSGTNANQYYFDGFIISYPYHLGNQSSVLNNNIIKSVDVYTGAYSARYGYASGGIINIEGKDEVKRNISIVNFNLFLSDALIETKLTDKSYMIAAARKSYPNVTLLKLYPDAIPPDAKYANYEDFQFKTGWEISPEHKVSFSTFGARDRQQYTKAQDKFENQNYGSDSNSPIDLSRPPIGLDRSFRTDGFRYTFQPGSKVTNTVSISRNTFKEFYELKVANPLTAENIFGYQQVSVQNIFYAEELLNISMFKDYLRLQIGATYRERTITQKAENITSKSSIFGTFINDLVRSDPVFRALVDGDGIHTKEVGSFAEMTFDYGGFRFMPGVRQDYYNIAGQRVVSPRLNTSYTFDATNTTILAGAGDHYNAPTGISQISQNVGNKNLKMEKGEHMAAGVSQDIGSDWLIKLEGFRNIYSNLVVEDNYIMNPYALNNLPSDIIEKTDDVMRNPVKPKPLRYSNSGTGFSEGVEVYLKKTKKPNESGWFGWISYTNSITKRNNHQSQLSTDERNRRSALNSSRTLLAQTKVGHNYVNYYNDNEFEFIYDNDRERLYDLDRTHILNIVFGWKINPNWQVGSRFRYLTNTPITPIDSADRLSQATTGGLNLYIPKYSSNYNSNRLAPWHQLDIRIDRFYNYDWGILNVYFELINAYGQRNAAGQMFSNFKPFGYNSNPSTTYDTVNSPYIQSPVKGGRLVYLPLINFGVEARF